MVHDFPLDMFINLKHPESKTKSLNELNPDEKQQIKFHFKFLKKKNKKIKVDNYVEKEMELTFWPLSMNLTAKSSLVHLSLTNLATPKFPDPISFTISYRSMYYKTPQINTHKKKTQNLYVSCFSRQNNSVLLLATSLKVWSIKDYIYR